MKRILVSNWDMFLVRGILAILFGIATLLMPGITLVVLVVLFGSYALLDGVVLSILAFKNRKHDSNWWLMLLTGLLSIAAGVATFAWPGITTISLFYVIVAWASATGISEVIYAIRFRKEIEGEWLLVLDGMLSVGFGILLIAQPIAGALAVLGLIGVYAIAYGVMLAVLAFRLRNLEDKRDAQQIEQRPAHQSLNQLG
ncbi:MAG: HdeD family acid-resistance protein [Anaerolineae bacterium]|nr:HdeD family acid-resistance protein [Anaerolineae bacterium]